MGKKIYMTDIIKKSGSSLTMRLSKKDFKMVDKEHLYKPGTKIRAIIEILEPGWEEDSALIESFGIKPTTMEPTTMEPIVEDETYGEIYDDPFTTSVEIDEDEIPDRPKANKDVRT